MKGTGQTKKQQLQQYRALFRYQKADTYLSLPRDPSTGAATPDPERNHQTDHHPQNKHTSNKGTRTGFTSTIPAPGGPPGPSSSSCRLRDPRAGSRLSGSFELARFRYYVNSGALFLSFSPRACTPPQQWAALPDQRESESAGCNYCRARRGDGAGRGGGEEEFHLVRGCVRALFFAVEEERDQMGLPFYCPRWDLRGSGGNKDFDVGKGFFIPATNKTSEIR